MIVVSHPSGQSFKWLAEYLGHDVKAQSSERVAWTHTLNCAHDDIASAVDEMLHTYLDRDQIRAQAGVRPGGATIEKPVKHQSLSWHPSEKPTRDEMIAAVQSYLKAQGWEHHQCAIFAHSDKLHQHVHLMINMVDPERGTRLKDHREWRKAQAWAHDYEKSRGRILCEERTKPIGEREASPPRNVWEQLRALQDVTPQPGPGDTIVPQIDYHAPAREWQHREWAVLKAQQKAQRIAFFENGRKAYGLLRQDIYRQVRATHRNEWAKFYRIMKHGAPKEYLDAMRTGLIARQSATLQEKCREAALTLRAERDAVYKEMLLQQKDVRAELADRQQQGLTSPQLLLRDARAPEPANSRTLPPRGCERGARTGPSPILWTARGSLVPQQRSARRWIDYAKDRIGRVRLKDPSDAKNALQREQQRLRSGKQRRRKEPEKAIGPTGTGLDL